MRSNFFQTISYLYLLLCLCNAKSLRSREHSARRLATSFTVGKTVIDYANPLIKSNGTIIATNQIDESVDDHSVSVTLLDFGCENEIERTGLEIELSNVTEYVKGGQYQWKIQVIPERLDNSPSELVQYSVESEDTNQNTAGVIQFCTRISTWVSNIQVGYVEHNVKIPFEINDNIFSASDVFFDQDNPEQFTSIHACQCEAFNCVKEQTPLQEDTRFNICLIPMSVVGDSRITNLNLRIADASDEASMYEPIEYGVDSWNPTLEAVVQQDSNSATIMINTLFRSGTMSEDRNKMIVSGGALIEVTERTFSFHIYSLFFDVEGKEVKGVGGVGLIRRLLSPLVNVIFKWNEFVFSRFPTFVFILSDELVFIIDP